MNEKRSFILSIILILFLTAEAGYSNGREFSNDCVPVTSMSDNDNTLNRGYILYREGKLDQAEQIFLDILRANPLNYDARINLGSIYSKRNLINKAVSEYETSIKLNPKKPQAFFNLGLIYSSKKKFKQALKFFKKANEVDPGNRTTLYFLGEIYFSLKNYDKALECFLAAWHLDPDSEQNLYKIADIYQLKGNYELEAAIYKDILRRRKSYYAYFRLGIALNKLNDKKGEINAYKNALILAPDNTDIIFNLALAYYDDNRLDLSIEQFEKLINNQIEPDEDALYYSALIYAKMNNLFKAWQYYEILKDINIEKSDELYSILKKSN